MAKNQYSFTIGKPVPEELNKAFQGAGTVYGLWLHPNFSVFLKDYQGLEDILAWNSSKFKLSVSVVDDIVFIIVHVEDLGLYIDVPYFHKKTPITYEELSSGPQYLHLFLMDDSLTLKAHRGIEFSEDTRQKLGELYKKQWDSIDNVEEFENRLQQIYEDYPTTECMLDATTMIIEWEEKPTTLN